MAKKKKKTVRSKKKASRKKTSKKAVKRRMKEKVTVIGLVTHYFPKVNAAVVKLKKPLTVGDSVIIKGSTTEFEQRVDSMQIDHVAITKAKKGDEIGLQVSQRVREHDLLVAPKR